MKGYRLVWLGLGCALFLFLLVRLGPAEIAALIAGIGWNFAAITVAYFGHQLIRATAYWQCVAAQQSFAYWDIVRIRLSGEAIQFLTFTGPFLAEPTKVWLLRGRGLSTKQAVAATVNEYLLYTFSSAALAVASLAFLLARFQLPGLASSVAKTVIVVMAVFLLAAAFAIIRRFYLIGTILKSIRRLPVLGRRMRLKDEDIRETEDLLFAVLRDRPRRFASILAVEFVAQALLILELFLLLNTTGKAPPILDALLLEGATKFVGLVFFFVPAQMGASEGAYALFFSAIGISASTGFALALARRIRSLIVAGLGIALAPRLPVTPAA